MIFALALVLAAPVEPIKVQLAAVRISTAHILHCRKWNCLRAAITRSAHAAYCIHVRTRSRASERLLVDVLHTAEAIAVRNRKEAVREAAITLRACNAIDGGDGELAP